MKGLRAAAKELQEHFKGGVVTLAPPTEPTIQHERPNVPFDPAKYLARLNPNHEALQTLGLETETLIAFQAGFASYGSNVSRLAIRTDDFQGKCLGFIGQALTDQQQPPLIFPNGYRHENVIFNAHRIQPGEVRVLSDVLSVLQAYEGGETNVVSFLTDTASAEQVQLFVALLDLKQCVWTP